MRVLVTGATRSLGAALILATGAESAAPRASTAEGLDRLVRSLLEVP